MINLIHRRLFLVCFAHNFMKKKLKTKVASENASRLLLHTMVHLLLEVSVSFSFDFPVTELFVLLRFYLPLFSNIAPLEFYLRLLLFPEKIYTSDFSYYSETPSGSQETLQCDLLKFVSY